MTDTAKYKNVSLKLETYNKLKDLSHINTDLTLSISGTVNMLVNEAHKKQPPRVVESWGVLSDKPIRSLKDWFSFTKDWRNKTTN